jgi:hypothetical protein
MQFMYYTNHQWQDADCTNSSQLQDVYCTNSLQLHDVYHINSSQLQDVYCINSSPQKPSWNSAGSTGFLGFVHRAEFYRLGKAVIRKLNLFPSLREGRVITARLGTLVQANRIHWFSD